VEFRIKDFFLFLLSSRMCDAPLKNFPTFLSTLIVIWKLTPSYVFSRHESNDNLLTVSLTLLYKCSFCQFYPYLMKCFFFRNLNKIDQIEWFFVYVRTYIHAYYIIQTNKQKLSKRWRHRVNNLNSARRYGIDRIKCQVNCSFF